MHTGAGTQKLKILEVQHLILVNINKMCVRPLYNAMCFKNSIQFFIYFKQYRNETVVYVCT